MLTSANRSRTGRSVLEAPVGQPIIHFQDLWLARRVLASQGKEADLVLVQIHFTAHQAARPNRAHPPRPPQQGHLALSVGASQIDESAARSRLEVQLPVDGEGPAGRGRL